MKLPEQTRRFTLLLLALTLFVGTSVAQVATGKSQVTATKHPFLWRIDGHGDNNFKVKSWLYGTMHLGDKRLVTLPKVVDNARENADALYCELDMIAMSKNQLRMVKAMMLPKGQKLSDRLSPELYARLDKYLRTHGVSAAGFDQLKVWAVTISMGTLDLVKDGFTHSLDDMIYRDARNDDIEVGGLETMDEQIQAFIGASESDQIRSLEQALTTGEKYDAQGRSQMKEMLECYLSGDTQQLTNKLEESFQEDPELATRMMKPLLDDRNVRMTQRMIEKLVAHPGKSYFFAVGAMHYPGKKGILKLMRAKGYRITRINPPPTKQSTDLAAQVETLETRMAKLLEVLTTVRKENARFEVRVRKLEFQIKALQKRLR